MSKILLFIPMYNCEKQIIRVLSAINDENRKYFTEILIINNFSTDKSEKAAIDYCKNNNLPSVKILRNKENYGLGGSHKIAFNYAIENDFDYIIVLHGDNQGDINDIVPYLETNEYEKWDCLLGARFMKGAILKGYSKFRTFGNYVYDLLFTLGLGFNIYDLGSGLNMYKVNILKNKFYEKFVDNLMFNYCMIMASAYYKHSIKFFPISWKETDQVSNVKLTSQAILVLKLLMMYLINKRSFMKNEHRSKIIEKYQSNVIYEKNS